MAPAALRAEIAFAESLEWLVDNSVRIGVAEVTGFRDAWKPGLEGAQSDYRSVQMKVTKALKGKPPETLDAPAGLLWRPWPPPEKAEVLLFLGEDSKVLSALALSGRFEKVSYNTAFTKDFRVLSSRQEILEAVETRLALKRPGKGNFQMEVPEESPAFKALWGGSACYLRVPADPEYREGLMKALKSPDVHARARAARRLAEYPGPETEKALRALLADPGAHAVTRTSKGGTERLTAYPARRAAWEALKALGVSVPRPEGLREDALDVSGSDR